MDEPWKHAKWNKPVSKEQKYTCMKQLNSQTKKQNGGCQELEGEENEELMFKGYRLSIWKDTKVLEMDGGDGCKTM